MPNESMDLEQCILENADLITATTMSAATVQTWASGGILHLPENRANPGTGKKRLYSRLDIARIAAMKALTLLGVSATVAAQITERLQTGPTADAWKQALVLVAPQHLCLLSPPAVPYRRFIPATRR
jgi:DNA-binding transcriptional MerR regulator